jgi:prevent-host-death family protein
VKNTLTITMIRRRGMAAIEDALDGGPVRIMKRCKPVAVVLSEADYRRLAGGQPKRLPGLTAAEWLLAQPSLGERSRHDIDEDLDRERGW